MWDGLLITTNEWNAPNCTSFNFQKYYLSIKNVNKIFHSCYPEKYLDKKDLGLYD